MNTETTITPSQDNGTSAKLLDVKAVADMLACSSRTVYRLADAGRMPAPLRVGALVRWSRQAVEDWIAAGCKPVRSVSARK